MTTATQEQLDAFNSAIASGDYQSAYNMGTAAGFSANDLASYVNQTYGDQFGTGITGDYLTGQFGGGAQQAFTPEPQNSFTQTAAQAASNSTWTATTAGAGGLPPNVTQGGLSQFQGLINAGQFQNAYNLGKGAGYSDDDLAKYVNQNWNGQFGTLTGEYLKNTYGAGTGPNGPDYSTLGAYNPADPYNLANKGPNPQYASGYGGYQPDGSAFKGDNPMPESYRQQIPVMKENEKAIVTAYVNAQVEQAKRNGYSPDTLMNNLNGYLTGKLDKQIEAQLLNSANSFFENNIPGWSGYVTNDYGFRTIPRGAEQVTASGKYNTAAPAFSKSFDANMAHDSLFMPNTLYDYINSTMGWAPGSPNYADPKNRTPDLNRRLTDAEIKVFQDNPGAAAERFKTAAYGAGGSGVGATGGGATSGFGAIRPNTTPTMPPTSSGGGIPTGGSTSSGWGGWTGDSGNVNPPIPVFNTNTNSAFSGENWRDVVTAGTGLKGSAAYNFIADKASSGADTLSTLQSKLGLNPGEVMAIYEEAVAHARANGLPVPLLPAVTNANKPYYNYGFGAGQQLFDRTTGGQTVVNPIAAYLNQIQQQRDQAAPVQAARGGHIKRACGGLCAVEQDPIIKRYMRGGTGGQDDKIPALLSDGEYVMDAEVVSALGDGNSEAGARKLDAMRENIRRHKRGGPAKSIAPKAKSPEKYLKGR